jgi:hypothetical protein
MASASSSGPSDESLRAAGRHQTTIIATGDAEAFAAFLHPDFLVNGPNNRCGGRDQVLGLFKAGALSHEQFEREVESTSITGNVGIVMGKEMVVPSDGSPLAAAFGRNPLQRRFTDVYLFDNGVWTLLARQASVVREVVI